MAKGQTSQTYRQARNVTSGLEPGTAAGYQNFANTGGITPQQIATTQAAAGSGVGSIFSALKDNLSRQKRIQGGYSPGYGANIRRLGTQAAETAGDVTNRANLGLDQMIQQGKLAGLGGLGNLIGMFLGPQLKTAVQPGFWQGSGIGDILSGVGGFAGAF